MLISLAFWRDHAVVGLAVALLAASGTASAVLWWWWFVGPRRAIARRRRRGGARRAPPAWQGTPAGGGAAEGCFAGIAPLEFLRCRSVEKRRRVTLGHRAVAASPTIPRLHLPQGACLAWKRGTSGEEQR